MIYKFEVHNKNAYFDTNKMILCVANREIQLNKKEAELENKIYYKFSDKCNIRCVYCFQQEDTPYINSKFDISNYSDILQFICNDTNSEHIIYGGEPLLIENIKAISYLFSITKNKFNFFTNGCWEPKILSFIKKNHDKIDSLIITLDGSEKVHNTRRMMSSRNGFQLIISNLKELYTYNISIIIQINVDLDNHNDTFILLEYLKNNLQIQDYIISLNPVLHTSNTISEIDFLKYSFELVDAYPHMQINSNSKVLRRLSKILFDEGPQRYRCEAGKQMVLDFSRNNVYTCPQSLIPLIGTLGEKQIDIDELRRKDYLSYNYKKMECCNKCDYLYLCKYGCNVNKDLAYNYPQCMQDTHESLKYIFDNFIKYFDIEFDNL